MNRLSIIAVLLVAVGGAAAVYIPMSQNREIERTAMAMTGGDIQRGKTAINNYGCGTCHNIPGIAGAEGKVGPPLQGIAERMYVGGVLTNTPDNLMHWIQDPRGIDEKTAMPVLGVNDQEAKDIAAYLYTLK
jgi:cytochrome c